MHIWLDCADYLLGLTINCTATINIIPIIILITPQVGKTASWISFTLEIKLSFTSPKKGNLITSLKLISEYGGGSIL